MSPSLFDYNGAIFLSVSNILFLYLPYNNYYQSNTGRHDSVARVDP
jgi:hypothetical protein